MADPLASIRWIIGHRSVTATTFFKPELIATVVRAYTQATWESDDRQTVYRPSGWASDKAGAIKLARKIAWPFTPVLNMRWKPSGDGATIVFSEGMLLNGWIALAFYSSLMIFVIATSGGQLGANVRLGMIAGIAMFLANRWIARKDFDLLLDYMSVKTAALPDAEIATPPAPAHSQPTPPVAPRPQPNIVEARSTFGRRFR